MGLFPPIVWLVMMIWFVEPGGGEVSGELMFCGGGGVLLGEGVLVGGGVLVVEVVEEVEEGLGLGVLEVFVGEV